MRHKQHVHGRHIQSFIRCSLLNLNHALTHPQVPMRRVLASEPPRSSCLAMPTSDSLALWFESMRMFSVLTSRWTITGLPQAPACGWCRYCDAMRRTQQGARSKRGERLVAARSLHVRLLLPQRLTNNSSQGTAKKTNKKNVHIHKENHMFCCLSVCQQQSPAKSTNDGQKYICMLLCLCSSVIVQKNSDKPINNQYTFSWG